MFIGIPWKGMPSERVPGKDRFPKHGFMHEDVSPKAFRPSVGQGSGRNVDQ